jgi:hypothetical protein
MYDTQVVNADPIRMSIAIRLIVTYLWSMSALPVWHQLTIIEAYLRIADY